jgi:hypothetical protein
LKYSAWADTGNRSRTNSVNQSLIDVGDAPGDTKRGLVMNFILEIPRAVMDSFHFRASAPFDKAGILSKAPKEDHEAATT